MMGRPPQPIHGDAVKAFTKFISARERHRVAKEGQRAVDKPDPIISKFRFCNVRRNDDRVTKWIHENYLRPYRSHPDLWFALVVARLFNLPSTLGAIEPWVLPFKPEPMRGWLKRMREDQTIFNAAYIVSTNGHAMDKVDYVIDRVLAPMWRDRKQITPFIDDHETLAEVHRYLMQWDGMGSFMAAQVVADLKYAIPGAWADFDTFAASGPGSRRGLNRVMGFPVDNTWREEDFRRLLLILRDKVNTWLRTWEPITAQDIQNCLCEYDKYERARTGEGRPKQLYKPADLPWKEN